MTAGAIRMTLADRDISRERLTLVFEDLRRFCNEGGYGASYARGWLLVRGDDNSRHIPPTEVRCGRSPPVRLEP